MEKSAETSNRLRAAVENAQVGLEASNQEFRIAKEALFELMKQMDVQSSHNAGWENRMTWFLIELHRQYIEEKA